MVLLAHMVALRKVIHSKWRVLPPGQARIAVCTVRSSLVQASGVVPAAHLKESGGPNSRSAFEGGNQVSPYVAGMTLVCLVLFLFFLSLSLERSKHLWTWPPCCPRVPPPGVASGCSSQGFTPPHWAPWGPEPHSPPSPNPRGHKRLVNTE